MNASQYNTNTVTATTGRRSETALHELPYEAQVKMAEARQRRLEAARQETAEFLGGIFDGDILFA